MISQARSRWQTGASRGIGRASATRRAVQMPIGRLGRDDEMVATARFLASDEASYITGHVLAVNGGMYT